jgi:7-carboxy-7-deazaguanine synthase
MTSTREKSMSQTKLRYTEKFFSQQGEGKHVGVPSVFLRMFGCNFRCKNFGRYQQHILEPAVTHNPEVVKIIKDLDQYATFDDLPLAETGCDSYSSVYPEFKRFANAVTADQLAQQLVDLLPNKQWDDQHLIITGGEPLLGWQRAYPELLEHPLMQPLKELTFETNGTQPLTAQFRDYLVNTWLGTQRDPVALTFSVSAKLSCSGESREDAIRPEVVLDYQQVGHTFLKLVVATQDDVNEALEVIDIYRQAGFRGPVYLMPVGGTEHQYYLNNRRVAELCLQHGLRYSPRLQVDLFGNAWGT